MGGDARRLCGIRPSPAGLHREARRQGERATGVRDRLCAMAADPEGRRRLRAMAAPAPAGFTLIIEIDAWNIRERDGWGRTAELRAAGEEPPRWHWVYTATVFRLDHRGATASGRPSSPSAARWRPASGSRRSPPSSTPRRSCGGSRPLRRVLVVADGAVWIWNLLAERFPGAAERLDLWHALEHLWELARGFHPQNPRAWIDRIVEDLKDHSDGASRLLEALEELGDLPALRRPARPNSSPRRPITSPTTPSA